MTPTLELQAVSKSFGDFTAVNGISFAVPQGTIYGLLGPNGAGKTTTLRMIMDIIAPDAGLVLLNGHPRYRTDLARVGYLPEERGLYRKMTVIDQLAFLAELHGIRRREALPTIESWLERVDLADWGKKKVEELSKGMQQKIQLIGTILHDPDLVILDEPFSGLDPRAAERLSDRIAALKGRARSVVLVSHDLARAASLSERVLLLIRGRAQEVPPEEARDRVRLESFYRAALETPA